MSKYGCGLLPSDRAWLLWLDLQLVDEKVKPPWRATAEPERKASRPSRYSVLKTDNGVVG